MFSYNTTVCCVLAHWLAGAERRRCDVLFENCEFIHSTYWLIQAGVTLCRFGFETHSLLPRW